MIDTDDIVQVKRLVSIGLHQRLEKLQPELRKFLKEHAILSGGAISSLYHREHPKDWDLYLDDDNSIRLFKDYINADEEIQHQVKDINPKYMVDTEVEGKMITSNAVTLRNDLQVITMATKSFRDTFDYIHCMPWYDIKNDTLYMSAQQYNAIKAKKLILNPKALTAPTVYRKQKYKERGWRE